MKFKNGWKKRAIQAEKQLQKLEQRETSLLISQTHFRNVLINITESDSKDEMRSMANGGLLAEMKHCQDNFLADTVSSPKRMDRISIQEECERE